MNDKPVQILWRCDPELKQWLENESENSGRSVTWLIEHAVEMWQRRLNRERATRAAKKS